MKKVVFASLIFLFSIYAPTLCFSIPQDFQTEKEQTSVMSEYVNEIQLARSSANLADVNLHLINAEKILRLSFAGAKESQIREKKLLFAMDALRTFSLSKQYGVWKRTQDIAFLSTDPHEKGKAQHIIDESISFTMNCINILNNMLAGQLADVRAKEGILKPQPERKSPAE